LDDDYIRKFERDYVFLLFSAEVFEVGYPRLSTPLYDMKYFVLSFNILSFPYLSMRLTRVLA